jgi:hypothetical protein
MARINIDMWRIQWLFSEYKTEFADVRKGGRGGMVRCGQMRTGRGGGVKNCTFYADVLYGWPLTPPTGLSRSIWAVAERTPNKIQTVCTGFPVSYAVLDSYYTRLNGPSIVTSSLPLLLPPACLLSRPTPAMRIGALGRTHRLAAASFIKV